MLKIENVEVLGWGHAIRGMRNPKNSWAKSDSCPECPYGKEKCCGECQYKGFLLDQLEDWQEILELAIAAGNTEIQKKAEKQIAKTNEKLKF